MPSDSERRALALLTVVFSLGVAVRFAGAVRDRPVADSAELLALDAQIARVESARAAGRGSGSASRSGAGARRPASRATRREAPAPAPPESPPALVDLDTAGEPEIERLPWIGPALAQRIVASRDKCGPFGSVQALTRVYGIGEKLAARLAPHVTFSAPSRPMDAVPASGCSGAAPGAATRRRTRS